MQELSAEKFEESPIIFGDFIKIGAADADKMYEELTNMKKLASVLDEVRVRVENKYHSFRYAMLSYVILYLQYLDDFNMSSSKEMKLVFFLDAIEHVSR